MVTSRQAAVLCVTSKATGDMVIPYCVVYGVAGVLSAWRGPVRDCLLESVAAQSATLVAWPIRDWSLDWE